jgi:hypothetical protein
MFTADGLRGVRDDAETARPPSVADETSPGRLMKEDFVVNCPYCGEGVDVHLERDVTPPR